MIAWRSEPREAVAIIPSAPCRYVMVRPGDGQRRPVDSEIAAGLAPEALIFYAPLPLEGGAVGILVSACKRAMAR